MDSIENNNGYFSFDISVDENSDRPYKLFITFNKGQEDIEERLVNLCYAKRLSVIKRRTNLLGYKRTRVKLKYILTMNPEDLLYKFLEGSPLSCETMNEARIVKAKIEQLLLKYIKRESAFIKTY